MYCGHVVLLGSNCFTYGPFNIHLTSSLLLDMIQLEYIYVLTLKCDRGIHSEIGFLFPFDQMQIVSFKADSKHPIVLVVHPQVSHILLVFYNRSCPLAV